MNLAFVGTGITVVKKVRFLSVLPDLVITGIWREQGCNAILQGYGIVKTTRVDEIL